MFAINLWYFDPFLLSVSAKPEEGKDLLFSSFPLLLWFDRQFGLLVMYHAGFKANSKFY